MLSSVAVPFMLSGTDVPFMSTAQDIVETKDNEIKDIDKQNVLLNFQNNLAISRNTQDYVYQLFGITLYWMCDRNKKKLFNIQRMSTRVTLDVNTLYIWRS